MGFNQVCVYWHTSTFSSDIRWEGFFMPTRMLKQSASFVLSSSKSSTYP
jgi:hypothetical protein